MPELELVPLPNNGIETSMVEPPSLEHLYPDPDEILPVLLVVIPGQTGDPTDNHWVLSWTISSKDGDAVIRRLQLSQETGYDHLTNWGPLTVTTDIDLSPKFDVGELSLAQRKFLEQIARETPVMMPNGQWNGQQWITDVLETAVKQDLLDLKIIEEILSITPDIEW